MELYPSLSICYSRSFYVKKKKKKDAQYIQRDACVHMGVIQSDSCIHHSAEYSHISRHVMLAEFCICIECEVLFCGSL